MKPLWTPPQDYDSALSNFLAEVNLHFDLQLSDYHELWRWSVEDVERFWGFWWQQAELKASKQPSAVLEKSKSFETDKWFPDARLNFAENLLRYRDERTAIIFRGEDGKRESLSYEELYKQAASVAREFQQLGVRKGDRVAAIMPNRAETIIGMLATSWLGAIWSSCSPDFGSDGILERFEQIQPKLLLSVDGYQFKGKTISVCEKVESIKQKLNCHCVLVNWQNCGEVSSAIQWDTLLNAKDTLPFEQVAFNDPLYILFSSGTTDKPKCIVHGVGGTLLQHTKEHRLHTDIDREDVLFYFTTCGWMMWNWLVSGLASGCTLLLFDGNPFYPKADALFQIAEEEQITVFGTSAKYISALAKEEVKPVEHYELSNLRTILSTGSPLAPESFDYVFQQIKPNIQLSSISGGTDIVSCFVLGCSILPVYRGELQCRGLGMAVDVWSSDGHSITNEPGELVCTKPFPSKPIGFWNDSDGERYHQAYFERFNNVWCHGDWAELTENNGLIITGRSDAVLNPGGVRIGTAEIYRQVERIPSVLESLAVAQDWEGDVRIVLFVLLKEGEALTESLENDIRQSVRKHASPRHVPAKILQVGDIPRTRSGKITELAVRDVINKRPIANTESLANPESLLEFTNRQELTT
jgi:acetoacetyl-CoA synthetase